MNSFEKFQQLHRNQSPLLIGNVWDVASARIFEKSGFKAIATSSWALAHSLGFEDGENLPFDLLYQTVERISRHVSIPFSVDLEGGYSREISEVIRHIEKLHEIGVVGINLEDSVNRKLRSIEDFAKILDTISNHLHQKGIDMFINARTDAYLLKIPSPLPETINRIKTYENAGASGIFIPYLDKKPEIREVVAGTSLPVNVFCTPQLPTFRELGELGVKRISMGAAMYKFMNSSLEKTISTIVEEQSFNNLFPESTLQIHK